MLIRRRPGAASWQEPPAPAPPRPDWPAPVSNASRRAAELALVLDLQAEHVLHVEHVHRAYAVGGDVRRGDLQPLVADRRGDIVQQAGPVAAVHLQARCGCWRRGCRSPRAAARGSRASAAPAASSTSCGFPCQADAAGQRLLDQHRQPRQPVRRIERAAGGVLDPERVERHAVGHRVDARIDDRRAGDRQRAGNLD